MFIAIHSKNIKYWLKSKILIFGIKLEKKSFGQKKVVLKIWHANFLLLWIACDFLQVNSRVFFRKMDKMKCKFCNESKYIVGDKYLISTN